VSRESNGRSESLWDLFGGLAFPIKLFAPIMIEIPVTILMIVIIIIVKWQ